MTKNISPLIYEQNRTYLKNDVIIYENKLYVVKEQFTATDFMSDKSKLQEQGSEVDLSNYYTKSETDEKIDEKLASIKLIDDVKNYEAGIKLEVGNLVINEDKLYIVKNLIETTTTWETDSANMVSVDTVPDLSNYVQKSLIEQTLTEDENKIASSKATMNYVNSKAPYLIWVGSQDEYDSLDKDPNTIYFIANPVTKLITVPDIRNKTYYIGYYGDIGTMTVNEDGTHTENNSLSSINPPLKGFDTETITDSYDYTIYLYKGLTVNSKPISVWVAKSMNNIDELVMITDEEIEKFKSQGITYIPMYINLTYSMMNYIYFAVFNLNTKQLAPTSEFKIVFKTNEDRFTLVNSENNHYQYQCKSVGAEATEVDIKTTSDDLISSFSIAPML